MPWSAFPIPASVADLSPQWFATIFGESTASTAVESIRIEPLSGLMSSVCRVHLKGDGRAPESVVVKLPAGERQVPAAVGFDREVRFYQELAELVPVRVPRAYLALSDDDSGRFALVLEDLRGFETQEKMDVESAALVVRQLAQLHARFWDDQSLSSRDYLRTLPDFIDRVERSLGPSLPRFLGRFDSQLSPGLKAAIEALSGGFREAVEPLLQAPRTLVHHDLTWRNVLFSGSEIGFIDWQLVQRNAGVRDLSFFIGSSASDIKGAESLLLGEYNARLHEHGIADYSREQCEQDYRRSIIADFGRMVMTGGAADLPDGMRAAVEEQLRNRAGSVERWDLLELL